VALDKERVRDVLARFLVEDKPPKKRAEKKHKDMPTTNADRTATK
jgi:hypothetical protein